MDPDRTAALMTPSKLADAKPAVAGSAAQWTDRMAADAGQHQLRRLTELREELEPVVRSEDGSAVEAVLQQLDRRLPRLDFDLLKPLGWWARATGKERAAGAKFAAQFQKIDQSLGGLAGGLEGLLKQEEERVPVRDRALFEVEVEYRGIEEIIDKGEHWIQDTRGQLEARKAANSDPRGQQQIRDDAARCAILEERLKLLRAVASAAQHLQQQARAAASRRTALLELIEGLLASEAKVWRSRVAPLAAVAGDSSSPALSLEQPMETHLALQQRVKHSLADWSQSGAQGELAAAGLDALAQQLRAAG